MSFYEENLKKLQKYCVYQDRCHNEVRTKLLQLKVYGDTLEEIMSELIQDDFLNEERYARSYVRGKYRQKLWGRNKITQHLKSKYVSDYSIKKGLTEINEEEYKEGLQQLMNKRLAMHQRANIEGIKLRIKLYSYAASRGFETELINEVLNAMSI